MQVTDKFLVCWTILDTYTFILVLNSSSFTDLFMIILVWFAVFKRPVCHNKKFDKQVSLPLTEFAVFKRHICHNKLAMICSIQKRHVYNNKLNMVLQYSTELEKKKLFIRGLPFSCTQEELHSIFSQVLVCHIIRHIFPQVFVCQVSSLTRYLFMSHL